MLAPKWTFTDALVASNIQQSTIYSIPIQLITMFQNRSYIPLSFFLVKNMERIRLEHDLKTHKSMTGIHVIDDSNFIDKKKLDYGQFSQVYGNFLRCLAA
jgi:hypothetical protein